MVEKLFTTHYHFSLLPWLIPLFSRCPFLLNLDLVGIANRFAQFNLPAFALGTLLLIPSAQKKAQQIQVSLHTLARSKPLGIDPWITISWESFQNFSRYFILDKQLFCYLLGLWMCQLWQTKWCHTVFSCLAHFLLFFCPGKVFNSKKNRKLQKLDLPGLGDNIRIEALVIGIHNNMSMYSDYQCSHTMFIQCWSLSWRFQGFLSVCNPVAVLEQVEELMNTGELAGIPSQVRFLRLDVATVLFSNLQSYGKTEVAAVLHAV